MSSTIIKCGRVSFLLNGNWLAVQFDGKNFVGGKLTNEQKAELAEALKTNP